MPTGLEEAVVGAVGVLGGVLKLAENPVVAWFMVLVILSTDAGIAGFFNWNGIVGMIFTFVIGAFLPMLHIVVTSFQVLVLVAVSPIVFFAIRKSRQLQKS